MTVDRDPMAQNPWNQTNPRSGWNIGFMVSDGLGTLGMPDRLPGRFGAKTLLESICGWTGPLVAWAGPVRHFR
jgi:hypothetical protein